MTRIDASQPLPNGPPEPGPHGGDAPERHEAALDSGTIGSQPHSDSQLDGGALLPDSPRRVLYVEDNRVNVFLMEAIFEMRPDLALTVAGTGAAALTMAVAAPPTLLLLDMGLPDTDGATLLARLREHDPLREVPAVAVSANALHEDIVRARSQGFADYWTKPLDVERTLAALDTLLP